MAQTTLVCATVRAAKMRGALLEGRGAPRQGSWYNNSWDRLLVYLAMT